MVVGYNHNIMYKGEVFHVQTEDSGINTPHIITLLYRGGNIIASKKTSYADIVKMGNLSQIVEELMKEQHKDMLRRLKSAEFDAKLGFGADDEPPATVPTAVAPVLSAPQELKIEPPPVQPQAQAVKPQEPAPPVVAAHQDEPPKHRQSLDDLIFEFLSSGDESH